MSRNIPLGAEQTQTQPVDQADLIQLGRSGETVAVLSTPAVIMAMELTAKALLAQYLDPGEESVGMTVDIEHLAPTPEGAEIRLEARVEAVDKRLVDFSVRAYDAAGEIARGKHRRAIVEVERFRAALTKRHPSGRSSGAGSSASRPWGNLVRLQTKSAVGRIVLNRPEKLNAMNQPLVAELESLLGHLCAQTEVRLVVLEGTGKAFCAGEDISENAAFDPAQSAAEAEIRGRVCRALKALPQPVICKINGPCMGGGLALALHADWIFASHAATFAMPEIRLGWPPAYALDALIRRVGPTRANQLSLTGETLSANEAASIGLIDAVLPQMRLEQRVQELAESLLRLPRKALARTKEVLWQTGTAVSEESLRINLKAYAASRASSEADEGIAAFIEKRPAQF